MDTTYITQKYTNCWCTMEYLQVQEISALKQGHGTGEISDVYKWANNIPTEEGAVA